MYEHKIEVRKSSAAPNGEPSRFPFAVTCSCGWQSFVSTESDGEILGQTHVVNRARIARAQGLQQGRI